MRAVKVVWSNKRYVKGFADAVYHLFWLVVCLSSKPENIFWKACLAGFVVAHIVFVVREAIRAVEGPASKDPLRRDFARGVVAAYAFAIAIFLTSIQHRQLAIWIGSPICLGAVAISAYYFAWPEEAFPRSAPPTGT